MAAKRALELTAEQQLAVRTTGKSLLVSAAAGSGKTAVLAERCAYLVCEARDPCDVDQLLVVTFTEAAAAEMKSRIGRAIREHVAQRANPRLVRQLALIDRMEVSTLHGFCAKLIRQHFDLLNLDPAFAVLDGDEASLLRAEVARQLFEDRYETDESGEFQAFVDGYGDGKDDRLIRQTIATHELLSSLVDPNTWFARVLRRIDEVCEGKVEDSELGRELCQQIDQRLADVLVRCRDAYKTLSPQKPFARYMEQLKGLGQMLRHWQEVLKNDGLDALCGESNIELPTLPTISNSVPGKEAARSLIDSVRDELKPDGTLRSILRFNCDQWTDGMKSMRQNAKVFLALVEEFGRRYRKEKDGSRTVDFSDLERFALKALSEPREQGDGALKPSPVARLLHKQFRHVLVDEYQDINEVQDAILGLVSTECLGPPVPASLPPNLFTVGDVKQSIYRFRLAEPHRLLNRHARFLNGDTSHGQVIDLQANFRSRAPLLDALNQVFRRLMTQSAAEIEYNQTQQLNPGLKYPPADGDACFNGSPIELHLLPKGVTTGSDDESTSTASAHEEELDRTEREALLVARRILTLTGHDGLPPKSIYETQPDGTLALRPIRFSDCVILLRSMRYKADQFAEILRGAGIPVHSESGTGYFDSMEVRDVLSLLKVLDNRRQDIPLAAFLRSPIASLANPEDALARVRLAYPNAKAVPFHEAVVAYAREHDDDLAAALKSLLAQLDRWREMSQRRPLAELLWEIYDSTGYLAFCTGLADGQQRVANLIDLHERARQFGSFHRQGLARFLEFLDSLQSESDLGQPPVVSGGEDVVRVMSIHRSKGLEFPVVILPDLGKAINLSDCSGSILIDREAGLGMSAIDQTKQIRYPSLASMLVEIRLRKQSLAEELRVLYVAMTRAKEHLILVGTATESKIDGWVPRFANHSGAFAADTILSARAMLDWIGPVSAANPSIFEVHRYRAQDIASWPGVQLLRPVKSKRQQMLAKLEPLKPEPAPNPIADAVLERLSWRYPFEKFSKTPAVQSVTSIAKESHEVFPAKSPAREPIAEFTPKLRMPRSLDAHTTPDATEVGSATHLLLQHLDFSRPCDADDVRAQLNSLLARQLILAVSAGRIDLDSICWFVSTLVGQLLRRHHQEVRRELGVYFARNPENVSVPASPADRVMIRSRIDVLIPAPSGVEIIDYKTDRVTRETLDDRIEAYRQQMDLYRDAIQALLGTPPAAIHLVFLHPRIIHSV